MSMDFWLDLPTRDFVQVLKTVKPKLRSVAKKAARWIFPTSMVKPCSALVGL